MPGKKNRQAQPSHWLIAPTGTEGTSMSMRTVHSLCLGVCLALAWGLVGPAGEQATGVSALQAPQGGRGAPPQKPAPPPDPKQLHEGTPEDDVVRAGTGDDWLFGQAGNDWLMGGGGKDKIDGGEGDDIVDGGAGDDILDGGAGMDTIRGGDGADTMEGGDDDDLLDGGGGNDDMDAGDGNDTLRGGPGDDVIDGADGDDLLSGQAGNDRLLGGDENDTVAGGAGDDFVFGGEGDDTVSGDAGDDYLDGDVGDDMLRGGPGNDTLLGSAGSDTLHGGDGHDILVGGDNADVLTAGAGHDWVVGGKDADVINGGDGDDLIILRAGDVPRDGFELVNGDGGTDVLILNGFDERGGAAIPRELIDPVTGGTYRLSGVERIEFTQLVADVGSGPNRVVSLLFANPSSSAATGRVIFFGPDGAIVPASIAAGDKPTDDLTFTVPPLGSLLLNATVGGPALAQVSSAVKLATVAMGGLSAPGGATYAEARFVDNAIVPIVVNRAAGTTSGLLLAGTVAKSSVTLTLSRPDGEEVDSDALTGPKDVSVPAYGHRFFYVADVFPEIVDFQGTLVVDGGYDRTSEGAFVAVTSVERGGKGAVSMLPAFPVGDLGPPAPIHLAGVSTGGGATSIWLVNRATNARAAGVLRFFGEDGQPWAVSVNGQKPAVTVPYDLANRGSLVLTLPAGGQVQRGTARADAKEGAVGAFVRMVAPDGRVTRLASSQVYSRFIAPARRNQAAGMTTRLSLSSTGEAATIQLQLRDAGGREVAGGTAEVRLAANGHATRSLEELFPSAAAGTFEGTVTFLSSAGPIAVTVVQTSGDAGAIVPLPLVPLQ
jgi:Ca2+-binding RTX toxin-like protein